MAPKLPGRVSFTKFVLWVLHRSTGAYFATADHIRLGLSRRLQVLVTLQNVRLNPSAFDGLHLPLVHLQGLIKEVKVKLSWSGLLLKAGDIELEAKFGCHHVMPESSWTFSYRDDCIFAFVFWLACALWFKGVVKWTCIAVAGLICYIIATAITCMTNTIHIDVSAIEVTFLDVELRLATLRLTSATAKLDLDINRMEPRLTRLFAEVGILSLTDDSGWNRPYPELKEIVYLGGSDPTRILYENISTTKHDMLSGFGSRICLDIAASRFNYVEPFVGLLRALLLKLPPRDFLSDAGSESISQEATEKNRMKLDLTVRSPIVYLYQEPSRSRDALLVQIDNVSAINCFNGPESTILAGVQGIRVRSQSYDSGELLELCINEDVDMSCEVTRGGKVDTTFKLNTPEMEFNITQRQYVALIGLFRSINSATTATTSASSYWSSPTGPTSDEDKSIPDDSRVTLRPNLKFAFAVGKLTLNLFDSDAVCETSLAEHGLVELSMTDISVQYASVSDGASSSDLIVKYVTLHDTRLGEFFYRELMRPAQLLPPHKNMLAASYSITSGSPPSSILGATIESPNVLFEVDPFLALFSYLQSPFIARSDIDGKRASNTESRNVNRPSTKDLPPEVFLSMRLRIAEASITILESVDDPGTEAVCITVENIVLLKEDVLALRTTQLGMAMLCMNAPDDTVDFLEKLDFSLGLDNKMQDGRSVTKVEVAIQPILLRASLRELNLITSTTTRTAKLLCYNRSPDCSAYANGDLITTSVSTPPAVLKTNDCPQFALLREPPVQTTLELSKEALSASFEGIQFVLIGDVHNLPVLRTSIAGFNLTITNWSNHCLASAALKIDISYWNSHNSHWEPIMDTWDSWGSAQKDSQGSVKFRIASATRLHVNITPSLLSLVWDTLDARGRRGNPLLKRSRNGEAPHRFVNRTGMTLQLWSESDCKVLDDTTGITLLDGETTGWRFESRKVVHDRVSDSCGNSIALRFCGVSWEAVRHIPVDKAGPYVYVLQPQTDKVAHRFLCDIVVKKSVKIITISSTYKIENCCLDSLKLYLVDCQNRSVKDCPPVKLVHGDSYHVLIPAVLETAFKIQLDPDMGYGWSAMALRWQDLLSTNPQTVSLHKRGQKDDVFRLLARAVYDSADPINRTYPSSTIRLQAPLELENLLPYNIRYSIRDNVSEGRSEGLLQAGELMAIHRVPLDRVVHFNANLDNYSFGNLRASKFALVYSENAGEFRVEPNLSPSSESVLGPQFSVNYIRSNASGGAYRCQIYSHFMAINKTGIPIFLRPERREMFEDQSLTASPFLFSRSSKQRSNFSFSTTASEWCPALDFSSWADGTPIRLALKGSKEEEHFIVSSLRGKGKYELTTIIAIAPQFMIRNELSQEVVIEECGGMRGALHVASMTSRPLLKFLRGREPTVQLKYTGDEKMRPVSMVLSKTGVYHYRIASPSCTPPDLARLEISTNDFTTWLVIKEEETAWPYLIVNRSAFPVTFSQKNNQTISPLESYSILPDSEVRYAWDSTVTDLKENRICLRIGESTCAIDLLKSGFSATFAFKRGNDDAVVSLEIHASGPTQVLTISNAEKNRNISRWTHKLGRSLSRSKSDFTHQAASEIVLPHLHSSSTFVIDCQEIGFSLINQRVVEVAYLTLSGFLLHYLNGHDAQSIRLSCREIQVDNQLHEAVFPVVVQQDRAHRESDNAISAVSISLVLPNEQIHGVNSVQSASVVLQPLIIQLEEDFVLAVLDCMKSRTISSEAESNDASLKHLANLAPPNCVQKRLYLYIQDAKLQLAGISISFIRTERINTDEPLRIRGPVEAILNALSMAVGNVHDFPLNFPYLHFQDSYLTVQDLGARISAHYNLGYLTLLSAVGSADCIGNPTGLFVKVGSGVADIFMEPYKRVAQHGPGKLGIGIAKGVGSFANKTVFGVADSLTKVTGSLGKGVSALTFDPKFRKGRESHQRRNPPKNAIFGLKSGAEALATSLSSGFEGIVRLPYEGAKRHGAVGLIKGAGQGLLGAIAKPAVGVLDLSSNITGGICGTTMGSRATGGHLQRQSTPRHTPLDGILRMHSEQEALGHGWIKEFLNRYFKKESYITQLDNSEENLTIILTNKRVLAAQTGEFKLPPRWNIDLSAVTGIHHDNYGISITKSDLNQLLQGNQRLLELFHWHLTNAYNRRRAEDILSIVE